MWLEHGHCLEKQYMMCLGLPHRIAYAELIIQCETVSCELGPPKSFVPNHLHEDWQCGQLAGRPPPSKNRLIGRRFSEAVPAKRSGARAPTPVPSKCAGMPWPPGRRERRLSSSALHRTLPLGGSGPYAQAGQGTQRRRAGGQAAKAAPGANAPAAAGPREATGSSRLVAEGRGRAARDPVTKGPAGAIRHSARPSASQPRARLWEEHFAREETCREIHPGAPTGRSAALSTATCHSHKQTNKQTARSQMMI